MVLSQLTVIRRFHVNRKLDYREDYDKLGLDSNAGEKEIKKAYIRLAKKLHPDSSGKGNELQFQQVTESYRRLLKDVQEGRNNYNRHETSRNSSQTGWYGWEAQKSFFSKNRVIARKFNIALRVCFLTIMLLIMLKNIFKNK